MAAIDRWYFDRIAPVYDLAMPAIPADELRAGLALVDGDIRRVLDLGGGTGRAARVIRAPDRVVIDTSRGMLRRVPPAIAGVLASATDLPVADGTVDAIVVVDALHHLSDHDRVLAEASRVLRRGGVLVVRDFDRTSVRGRLLEAAERAIRLGPTFRSADGCRRALEAAGFETTVLSGGFSYTVAGRKPGGP